MNKKVSLKEIVGTKIVYAIILTSVDCQVKLTHFFV